MKFEEKIPDLIDYINKIGSRVIKEDNYYKYQLGPIYNESEGLRLLKELNKKGYEVLLIRYDKKEKEILKFMN